MTGVALEAQLVTEVASVDSVVLEAQLVTKSGGAKGFSLALDAFRGAYPALWSHSGSGTRPHLGWGYSAPHAAQHHRCSRCPFPSMCEWVGGTLPVGQNVDAMRHDAMTNRKRNMDKS